MIFTFFTIIVFIAELIITFYILCSLIKFDKQILLLNTIIEEAQPCIKSIVSLVKRISEQIHELIYIWIENLNKAKEKFIAKQVKNFLIALIFWKINSNILNKIRKSKIIKLAMKGFNLLQSMV